MSWWPVCYIKREGSYINLFCFMVLRKTNFYIWPSNYVSSDFFLVMVNLNNMIKSPKNLNFVCLFNVWNWIINQKSAETIPIIHSLVCGTCKWFLDNGSWTIFKQQIESSRVYKTTLYIRTIFLKVQSIYISRYS